MPTVTLGLIQGATFPSKGESLARHVELIRDAAAKGAQIICLQELFNVPYFCTRQDPALFDLAEPVPGPTTAHLAGLAKELGVVIIIPLFEKRGPGLYHNSMMVIDADGAPLGKYRKMHIPQDPGFEEKFYFTPGDLGYPVWDTR
ncbi:MAG TPA: nitrilase-related carbon-nitrogen hydrolase, partial [Prosthecobacter sp.]|nr:nitrilase-related carbon-nitrogen hydrolase [Prosthecobacter sp.]